MKETMEDLFASSIKKFDAAVDELSKIMMDKDFLNDRSPLYLKACENLNNAMNFNFRLKNIYWEAMKQ